MVPAPAGQQLHHPFLFHSLQPGREGKQNSKNNCQHLKKRKASLPPPPPPSSTPALPPRHGAHVCFLQHREAHGPSETPNPIGTERKSTSVGRSAQNRHLQRGRPGGLQQRHEEGLELGDAAHAVRGSARAPARARGGRGHRVGPATPRSARRPGGPPTRAPET